MFHTMPFSARALKKHFLWRWYCGKKQIELWFCVLRTLINNDTHHHSDQNLLWAHLAVPWESTTFWPLWWRVSLSIRVQTTLNHIRFFFYHNINIKKNVFFFHSMTKSVTHWCEQRCLDSYRPWQISQTDCEINSNYGKNNVHVIYQTWVPVLHQDIQTLRRELKVRRAAEYFWQNLRWLDSW